MRPEDLRISLNFDDILLLPCDRSNIISRKTVDTTTKLSRNVKLAFPIIASPMDTIADVDTCIALNKIGAAGVLHRFMSIKEQTEKAELIKEASGVCFSAIGLQDYKERIIALLPCTHVFVLDSANGSSILVENLVRWYSGISTTFTKPDLIVGNTLTKASVSRAINLGADGVRHGIGIGSACSTTEVTGIGCPPVTALYYGWKAIRNWELEQTDIGKNTPKRPSLLLDGGIRKAADLVKAIVCGADAVICGHIFAGCKETPGEIYTNSNGVQVKRFRGMASKEVVEEYNLWDGAPENLFVEGKELEVPALEKSVTEIVYEFVNGLRSALSYLGFSSLKEARGALWEDRCLGIRL